MLFSSLLFLYFFLPVTLLLTVAVPARFRNVVLLIASLVFYAWGGVSYSLLMLFSIAFNYMMARAVSLFSGRNKARLMVGICVFGNLLLLVIMKYSGFAMGNINRLLFALHYHPIHVREIDLPAGISFFTFHALSYVIDIYRNECPVQKNPVRLALYISFFPQLIAGPIIRYHDIASQLTERRMTLADFAAGTERFILGLAKKVMFSNVFALPATEIFATPVAAMNTPLAWFGAICYTLHIYCDFSGYSDMALGLGRMFGFHFPENFNFPYLARSVKEFWTRWHISLSTWFRDYLYIPLGGNRKGPWRTYLNLLIVFFLTGLWHGASWNFVIWGFIHGTFLIIERLFLGKWLAMLPGLNLLYTLFVVVNAWVFFNAQNLHAAVGFIKMMYGALPAGIGSKGVVSYLNPEFVLVFSIAVLGASGFFKKAGTIFKLLPGKLSAATEPLRYASLLVVLFLCSVCLLCSTYNPFIYFRF